MKELNEMTDREIQEAILANGRTRNLRLKSINGWVTFLGVIQLIIILAAIFLYLSQ